MTTIETSLEKITRRILNDPDIFYIDYTVFNENDWNEMKEKHKNGETEDVKNKIQRKINDLETEIAATRNNRGKEKIEKAKKLTESLKDALDNRPYIAKQIFSMLDKFGVVKCNLPRMEDYGKVIEIHSWEIAEQFFLYKIGKTGNNYEKKALIKVLEYIKEIRANKIDILEIAFFVRKLNDLTQFWEVLK